MNPVAAGRSAELVHRLVPSLAPGNATERPITVDQTNYSVVVAEAVVVKWLAQPVIPPQRGALLMAHLAEVGFDEMPPMLGVHVEDGRVVAVLTGFVSGALDGWDWYVDELLEAFERESLVTPLATAERLGRLGGRMCNALATPSAFIAEPVSRGRFDHEHRRGTALLREASERATGDLAMVLAERAERIAAVIDALGDTAEAAIQPVHADFHVGQILRTGDRLVVNDFDGNPVGGSLDPLARRSAMVDVASLVQSVDHVGRIAARRVPHHDELIGEFIAAALPRTRDTFIATLERHLLPAEAEIDRVLDALCVMQELHEVVYAAKHLPRWAYVPMASLTAMFP
jgi:maltokinase